jgi:prepilin signal peptidase PulO-like enzyme (type II secretory pathway)
MFHKFKVSEIVILVLVIILIFVSEYEFVYLKNPTRAIFIGLWPPTILALLIYFNTKLKN